MSGSLDSVCQVQASQVREYIEGSAVFGNWEAPRQELIPRFAAEPAWMLALPLLCCQAAGGEGEAALPAAAAWLCMRRAAHLLDSVADLPTGNKYRSGIAAGLIYAGFQFVTETTEFPGSPSHPETIYTGRVFFRNWPEGISFLRTIHRTRIPLNSIGRRSSSNRAASFSRRCQWRRTGKFPPGSD